MNAIATEGWGRALPRPAAASREWSFGLDAVRAVAVMLVLVAHGSFVFMSFTGPLKPFLLMGYVGVELFFALSGFLLGGALIDSCNGSAPVVRFWQRRWARTLPLYFLFLGVNWLLARQHGEPTPDFFAFVVFLQNFATPHPIWFTEAWSLSIEELFYLVAPLIFWGAASAGVSPGRTIAAWLAGALVLHVAYVVAADPVYWDEGIHKVGIARADAIAWGVAASWWARGRTREERRRAFNIGVAALAIACVAYATADLDRSAFARFVLLPLGSFGAAAMLPAVAAARAPAAFRGGGAVRALARWAYPLYLMQLPALRLMIWTFGWVAQDAGDIVAQLALYAALSVGGAAVLHACIERPVLAWRDRRWPASLRGGHS